jgi:hypothetical protein
MLTDDQKPQRLLGARAAQCVLFAAVAARRCYDSIEHAERSFRTRYALAPFAIIAGARVLYLELNSYVSHAGAIALTAGVLGVIAFVIWRVRSPSSFEVEADGEMVTYCFRNPILAQEFENLNQRH